MRHHARELHQQTVASGFNDASAMLSYFGIGKCFSVGFQSRQRAFLVDAHQAALLSDICCQYCRKSAFHAFGQQTPLKLRLCLYRQSMAGR
jgi:hypothetical protein